MKQTKSERIFQVFNNAFLILLGLFCLLPYVMLLAKSFSSEAHLAAGNVLFWPRGFNTLAYQVLLGNNYFVTAFRNSVIITVGGTAVHVFFTLCVGYFCSKDKVPGARLLTRMYVFTMLFGGGLIPTYLVIRAVGLMNNLLVMILPGMVSTFNLIMARNYFYTIPDSIEESAMLDGASNMRTFFSIMLPMVIPSVATIAIFSAVGLWNSYMGPLMYLTKSNVRVLSVYLRDIVTASEMTSLDVPELYDRISSESFRAAAIFVSSVPILLVYPFLQKYFIVGVTLGAVKE
ncbi:MAG: carbohydrate ABC transporter permease [Christensenellales bacterium]|jgi:putative aldouronate transport system permease protein